MFGIPWLTPQIIELLMGGGGTFLLFLLFLLFGGKRKSQPHALPPPAQPATLPQNAEPPAPVPPPLPHMTTVEIIDAVINYIPFTQTQIQVGVEQVGDSVIGVRHEECPWPTDRLDVRPLRSIEEIANVMPSERRGGVELQMIRALSGGMLVPAYEEEHIITKPEFKPVYRRANTAVYVLLDVSPSMYPGHGEPWREKVAKGTAIGILEKAMREKATFMIRTFAGTVSPLATLSPTDDPVVIKKWVESIQSFGPVENTCINPAIMAAVGDFADEKEKRDAVEIVILTDGEDNNISPDAVRTALAENNMRLHAVLLGIKNDALRGCADTFIEVTSSSYVKPAVYRQ